MTDVEAKSPTKRRISDKGEKKGAANSKKAKVTPMKQTKNSNKPNNNIQNNKKNKRSSELENGAAKKKLKPFVGTSQIEGSNEQKVEGTKKVAKQDKPNNEPKRPKNKFFVALKDKLQSDEKESAIKSVDDKIKDIESRDVISKTAKKKLRLLYRLKRIAGGKGDESQQNVPSNKTAVKGKKKGTEVTKVQHLAKKEVLKTQEKGVQKKANELNKKQDKIQTKPVNKKAKQVTKVIEAEESSDEDDESEETNELEEDEDSGESDDEVEEEEQAAEGEDESGDEEEESDENGEDDSDDSEEIIYPQVSNKKQKKK